jgi:hypothetical protein
VQINVIFYEFLSQGINSFPASYVTYRKELRQPINIFGHLGFAHQLNQCKKVFKVLNKSEVRFVI